MNTIGYNIRRLRDEEKLSQIELAKKIGICNSVLSDYEHDKHRPTYETLKKISDALNVNPAEIDESLAVDLGCDSIYKTEDGDAVIISAGTMLDQVLKTASTLNRHGVQEWLRFGSVLATFPENQIAS